MHICSLKKEQQSSVGSTVQRCTRFPRKEEGQLVVKEGFLPLLQEILAGLFSHYSFEHQRKFGNGLILNYPGSSL